MLKKELTEANFVPCLLERMIAALLSSSLGDQLHLEQPDACHARHYRSNNFPPCTQRVSVSPSRTRLFCLEDTFCEKGCV